MVSDPIYFWKKVEKIFRERAERKCYKMIVKNRGKNIIEGNVEALKNKGFEFPRLHRQCSLGKSLKK